MTIDRRGFRSSVAMVLLNDDNQVLWAKRIHQMAWQFPQGGILEQESPKEALFRELHEEIGLQPADVTVLAESKSWLYYRLPQNMIRYHLRPLCIGQKQKWFLLRLTGDEARIRFDVTDSPEFDGYSWVYYWSPIDNIIGFKKNIYRRALEEFSTILFN